MVKSEWKYFCNEETLADVNGANGYSMLSANTHQTNCSGYLRVYFVEGGRLKARNILNIKRKIPNTHTKYFYRLANRGTCCWRIFSNNNFRANSEKLDRGWDQTPQFSPKSAKKVVC